MSGSWIQQWYLSMMLEYLWSKQWPWLKHIVDVVLCLACLAVSLCLFHVPFSALPLTVLFFPVFLMSSTLFVRSQCSCDWSLFPNSVTSVFNGPVPLWIYALQHFSLFADWTDTGFSLRPAIGPGSCLTSAPGTVTNYIIEKTISFWWPG